MMIPEAKASKFWSRVDQSGGGESCWPWTRARLRRGYGQVRVNWKMHQTHRLAWMFARGPIPVGLFVCHRCDNPPCCNPAHLFLGTTRENNADMIAKGRRVLPVGPRPRQQGERNPRAKLSESQVCAIRERFARGGVTAKALGAEYGVTGTLIRLVVANKIWNHPTTTKEQSDAR